MILKKTLYLPLAKHIFNFYGWPLFAYLQQLQHARNCLSSLQEHCIAFMVHTAFSGNPNCGGLCSYLCFITLYDYMCTDCPTDYSNAGVICQKE